MSGRTKWKDVEHKASPERLAEARLELAEALTLAELRHAREMTQVQLANSLGATQPAVSRIEHQTDVYVSTIRSYIQALGGELEISARFGGTVVTINGFESLAEASEPHTAGV